MKFTLANILALLCCLVASTLASPIQKRVFQPTSPVFSLIAHHKGAVFQYNLVKFDGHELTLASDDAAFFGRIKAQNGYILNLPQANSNSSSNSSTVAPASTSVIVSNSSQLITTESPVNASTHFGIKDSLLTYLDSNKFVACPDFSFRGQYSIFFQGNVTNTTTICPNKAEGYEIQLMVQVDATLNYNPSTNKNSLGKRFVNFVKYLAKH